MPNQLAVVRPIGAGEGEDEGALGLAGGAFADDAGVVNLGPVDPAGPFACADTGNVGPLCS
ncbi:hypothetical protein [Streptomyces sp. NPDC090036]|uniref:hypothetical protein n=1 Tax=Streptomyces sp. NPDC090036 TaxID=3365926 RepID=UPI0038306679